MRETSVGGARAGICLCLGNLHTCKRDHRKQEDHTRDTLERDTLERDTLDQDTLERDTLEQDTLEQDTLDQDTLERDTLELLCCCVATACLLCNILGSLDGSVAKNPPAIQETRVRSLGWKDPLEEEIATHSSILA